MADARFGAPALAYQRMSSAAASSSVSERTRDDKCRFRLTSSLPSSTRFDRKLVEPRA